MCAGNSLKINSIIGRLRKLECRIVTVRISRLRQVAFVYMGAQSEKASTEISSPSKSKMGSADRETLNPPPPPETISSPSDGWIQRIVRPTILAGIVGGCVGTVSKHKKVLGLGNISAAYAANFAIVAATYCGMREMVRASRNSEPDDLIDSALGGFASGALLGRLQGGQLGAVRYSIGFAVAGTAIDYATQRLRPKVGSYMEKAQKVESWKLPEWSPIQIMDEEERAAKKAREKKMFTEKRRQLGLSDENP